MNITTKTAAVQADGTWTEFKAIRSAKALSIQYSEVEVGIYAIFAIDGPIVYTCIVSQDPDKTDFETNYKPYANKPYDKAGFDDPRLIRRFGNVTTTATTEVLASTRAYNEPASQAQRSVKSSSATDSDTLGTGARVVRITYLDSSYILKSEDVALNGIVAVNTVATDIRFVESFEVIKGAEAVGAVELFPNTGGTGTAICGISAATTQAFLCHHYTPAGKRSWAIGWGVTVDDEASLKLLGQDRPDGTNLVNRTLDLEKMFAGNPTPPTRLTFERTLRGVLLPEKTYARVTVVPNQATSTTTRAWLYLLEDVL